MRRVVEDLLVFLGMGMGIRGVEARIFLGVWGVVVGVEGVGCMGWVVLGDSRLREEEGGEEGVYLGD